ncbi:hypothetical protein EVJ58_g8932 [Rhodofomes roseus]|uniref:Amino acid permease/ SLC12A domain-containing protein n=1 Tax=Rhodofomes roseus TaxID=34475 RepID=A0A4Y9XW16_9APHY|nr:hypothetical protein EVJ58_g8932 [Rhodofomes roseus]
MATQYPVAGSFNAYATRFFSPGYGFALSWNYWFNDAVSVASDLTAAQLVLQFWTTWHPWVISLVFWVFLVGINAAHVRAYGELEYWLSFLKVFTIVLFIILGILVNVGVNREHEYIGGRYWHIPGAPFVGGFGGFARVFVTASFAFGGTESLGVTADESAEGEGFYRILLFYILSIALIGLNVPWNYPGLSNRSTTTSPFTLVFKEVGSNVAGSFMNTVILTSVLSAGNHALFAGTRVLYGLSTTSPRQAPSIFSVTTPGGVPLAALIATSSVSVLCFGSSFIGSGALWGWLQNIVGVSNQVVSVPILILIQGWSSVIPRFSAVDFVSFYIEIPVMALMYAGWLIVRRQPKPAGQVGEQRSLLPAGCIGPRRSFRWHDLVDIQTIDLKQDEYEEAEADRVDDAQRQKRLEGRVGSLWRLYYWVV